DLQRWTARRRSGLVVSILKGETSVQEAARKHGLTVAEIEEWRDRALLAMENALRSRPKDEEGLKDEENQATQAEGRRTGLGFRHREGGDERAPYGAENVRRIRQTLSKVSVRRACRVLEVSRTALRPRKPSPGSGRSMDELLALRIHQSRPAGFHSPASS